MSGVRDQRAKRQPAGRWYQCPGCWSGSFNRMTSDGYECECGERLFIIDLRDTEPSPFRPTTPAASDGSLDVERLARALKPGHDFVHDGGLDDCQFADDDAAIEAATRIAAEYERLNQ